VSEDLRELAERLRAYVAIRGGRLSLKELLKWSEEQDLSLLILDALIEDMVSRGVLRASSEREPINIGSQLSVELPKEVSLPSKSYARLAREAARPRKLRRRAPARTRSIVDFLGGPGEEVEAEQPSEAIEEVSEELPWPSAPEHPPRPESREPEAPPKEGPEAEAPPQPIDEDLEKAIAYLNDYWSVGELRLALDLKAMGVKNPERVIERLLELGYATRSSLGVINATEKLPKASREKSLSEVIFGA